MNKEQLIEKIHKYIKEKGGVSFVEIEHIFEANNFDYKGKKTLLIPEFHNVVAWRDWNDEAMGIIGTLLAGDVYMKGTDPLIYYIDGKAINLPVYKSDDEDDKDRLRWLPIVFNVQE